MQTYKFDELDERGKDFAFQNYSDELVGVLYLDDENYNDKFNQVIDELKDWRFNEHGERID